MNDRNKERAMQWLSEDFIPPHNPSMMPTAEHRIAAALEYIAHHIGKISRSLDQKNGD